MNVHELDTPAVVVDLDVMARNLARMADYCSLCGINLRPHTKTHKIPELARLQLASGAIGITVAKVDEAEIMVRAGMGEVLIAYPIVGQHKIRRVAMLAEHARITISLDSLQAIEAISEQVRELSIQVGILVELDVGLGRCGVQDEQAALALARRTLDLKGLEWRGLMFYPGHIFTNSGERSILVGQVNAMLSRVYAAFDRAGIKITVVSGGSTPTAFISHEFDRVTEIRPGMYVFNDRNMVGANVARTEDCALSVIVTVVSKAVKGRVIVDGGSKTFSSDRFLAGDGRGFGLVKEDPEAEFYTMSEEHGHLDVAKSTKEYRIGERLTIIPNHVCSTINMHDEIYAIRGERVETTWRVAARGKVR